MIGHCKAAILECIHGRYHHRVGFIRRNIENILWAEGRDEYLEYIKRSFIGSQKYPDHQGCGEDNYKKFELALRSFKLALDKLPLDDKEFPDNIRLYIAVLYKAAAFRHHNVLFPIVDISSAHHKFIKYLDRLGRYKVAIDTMSQLRKQIGRAHV